jgi:hypothetical protein
MALHVNAEIKIFNRKKWYKKNNADNSERKTPVSLLNTGIKEE